MDQMTDKVTQGIINTYNNLSHKEREEIMSHEEMEAQEEVSVEEPKSKKGSPSGMYCAFCEEKIAGYTKNGKLICSGCLHNATTTKSEFFNWKLSDLVSSVQMKGFHPSPLTISEQV